VTGRCAFILRDMASGINIYSELLISRIRILDISNSGYMLIPLAISVQEVALSWKKKT